MREEVTGYIKEILPKLISVRRKIHENPELSNNEIQTSKLVFDILSENDIKAEYIRDNIGVTATIKGPKEGPGIAYRADMDALSMEETTGLDFSSKNKNIMHSCGHDIHTAVLLGTALVLNKFKDNLNGNVRVIFQCGEENFTGAKQALEHNVLKDIDYILALHTWPDLPSGTIGLKKGAMMASSSNVSFEITGKGGHAAHPHRGVDPVMVSAYTMTAIQSIISRNIAPVDSAVITFGKLLAGTASNVIPNRAIAEGTVRTLHAETDKKIKERINDIVANQAKSFGAVGKVEYYNICPPVINDSHLIELLDESSKDSIGRDKINWLENPSMGSEDFAYYLQKVPGALIRLGTNNESEESRLPLHNTNIIFDERSIETGVVFMSNALIYLLKNI